MITQRKQFEGSNTINSHSENKELALQYNPLTNLIKETNYSIKQLSSLFPSIIFEGLPLPLANTKLKLIIVFSVHL